MKENKKLRETGKILYRFEKPKSKTYYLIQEDSQDPWFVYVKRLDKKTGKESSNSMIISKDLPDWIKRLKESGWEEKNQ